MNRRDMPSVALLLLMIAVTLPAFFGLSMQITIILLVLYVVILSTFSFVHGAQTLGRRNIIVFFCITSLVTYFMEWLGTHFGIPFGHYYYTDRLGPMLMDVPITIPFQWFNILYASYIMSWVFFSGWKGREKSGEQGTDQRPKSSRIFLKMLVISIIVGLFMVSWDFINDPFMVSAGIWVWTDAGEFFGLMLFGIPLSNFLGWVLTSAMAVLIFEFYMIQTDRIPGRFAYDNANHTKMLVLVPYTYVYIFQALNGLSSGVFSLISMDQSAPIILAAISGIIITILTVGGYMRTRPSLEQSS